MSTSYRDLTLTVRATALTCDGCKAEWAPRADDIVEVGRYGPESALTATGPHNGPQPTPPGWNALRLGDKRLDLCPACTAQSILDRRRQRAAEVPPATPATAPPPKAESKGLLDQVGSVLSAIEENQARAAAEAAGNGASSEAKVPPGAGAVDGTGAVTPDAVLPAGAARG